MSKKSRVSVRLLTPRATADGAQNRGDIVEVSAAEADRMCGSVPPTAELVRSTKPETATARRTSENTARRKPASKKA